MNDLFRLEVDTGSGGYGLIDRLDELLENVKKEYGPKTRDEVEKWVKTSKENDQFHKDVKKGNGGNYMKDNFTLILLLGALLGSSFTLCFRIGANHRELKTELSVLQDNLNTLTDTVNKISIVTDKLNPQENSDDTIPEKLDRIQEDIDSINLRLEYPVSLLERVESLEDKEE